MSELPGILDWKPAREHHDLLAVPVARALAEHPELACWVAPIDAELADTAAFCEAYEVGPEESANCVVVSGRRGEDTKLAACMVLATDRADVNKKIRKHLDVRKASFADTDTATGETAMEYGGITPVGVPQAWPILVDEAVAGARYVVIGSGIRGSKMAMAGADLIRLPGAEVIDLAQERT